MVLLGAEEHYSNSLNVSECHASGTIVDVTNISGNALLTPETPLLCGPKDTLRLEVRFGTTWQTLLAGPGSASWLASWRASQTGGIPEYLRSSEPPLIDSQLAREASTTDFHSRACRSASAGGSRLSSPQTDKYTALVPPHQTRLPRQMTMARADWPPASLSVSDKGCVAASAKRTFLSRTQLRILRTGPGCIGCLWDTDLGDLLGMSHLGLTRDAITQIDDICSTAISYLFPRHATRLACSPFCLYLVVDHCHLSPMSQIEP